MLCQFVLSIEALLESTGSTENRHATIQTGDASIPVMYYTVKNIRRIKNEKRVYESATYSKPF